MINLLCDVAIIGAGLAGLAAGDYLKSQGYHVIVLEAEGRVGGRVFTDHLSENIHVELGAFSFGNGEQPLWDYIHRFDLPIIEHTLMERSFLFKNQRGTTCEKGFFLRGKEQEIPLYQLMDYFRPELEKITKDLSFAEALQSVGASSEAMEWLQLNTLPGLLGNGFQSLSTKAVLAFLKQYDNSTSFYALRGGNDQLPQAFAEQLKGHIFFHHRVQKVERLKETCLLKGATFAIEAKRIIFAIPLPELSKIEIDPSLSVEKQHAIQNIFYTKCACLSIIAPPHILTLLPRGGVFLFSDQLGWFREQSAFQVDPQKKTIITINVVGDRAEKLSSSIEDWKGSINDTLSTISKSWGSEQIQYHLHVWEEGYPYFAPGYDEKQSCLKEPEGRFYFAGEHTSQQFASMNGAIESGIRAAKEILYEDFPGGNGNELATP
jgi:monoamine oxidase